MADWARVEYEYIETDDSIALIGRRHGLEARTIRQRAKKLEWERKFLADIAAEKREAELQKHAPEQFNREMRIKVEAQKQVMVVEKQTKRIARLNNVIDILLDRTYKMLTQQEFDGPFIGERESPADLVKKCAEATRHLVPLERQAFKIRDDDKMDDQLKKSGIVLLPQKKTEQEEDPELEDEIVV